MISPGSVTRCKSLLMKLRSFCVIVNSMVSLSPGCNTLVLRYAQSFLTDGVILANSSR